MFLIAAAVASLNNDFAGMMLFFLVLAAKRVVSVELAVNRGSYASFDAEDFSNW